MNKLNIIIKEELNLLKQFILKENSQYSMTINDSVVIGPDGKTYNMEDDVHGRALEFYPSTYEKAIKIFGGEKGLRNAITAGIRKLYFFMHDNGFIRTGFLETGMIYFSFSKQPTDNQVLEMFKLIKENSPNNIFLNLYVNENVERKKMVGVESFLEHAYDLVKYTEFGETGINKFRENKNNIHELINIEIFKNILNIK